MLHRLRLAHRLLLIYLLSFLSVAVLAYSLIAEKNIAIEFAQKEQRGNAYVAIARDALLAVIEDHLGLPATSKEGQIAQGAALKSQADAIATAERQYGGSMNSAALAGRLTTLLNELGADAGSDPAERKAQQEQAMTVARALISTIGDKSNLILDPDLASYYLMSIVVLRLPELTTAAVELADVAASLRAGINADESRMKFLLSQGSFAAAVRAVVSDNARALDEGGARHDLQASFAQVQSAITDFSSNLNRMLPAADGAPRRLLTATGAYWRLGTVELDRWLQQRIDRFYRRMAVDLGAAALVWLAALSLILIIARQITRPMRELATVAERVHHGEDYNLRARGRAGGEIGSLIGGFNAMLDRLQSEAAREQERVAADRASEAQRHLLGTIPIVISVAREADGRILYSNIDATRPDWLPAHPHDDPRDVLARMHPVDRATFLAAFRSHGRVDGFEARCLAGGGEFFWVLIGARALRYQEEPARLDVYTPINDRKRAETALAWRNAVLDAITYAAARIMTAADWRSAMPEFLSRLGAAIEVSRVFLFEIHPASDGVGLAHSCRFMWSAAGVPSLAELGGLENVPIPDAP